MKLMKIDEEPIPHTYMVGDTIEKNIVLKISDIHLICLDSGTVVDESILQALQKSEHLYTANGEIEDINLLHNEIKHVHNKTLLTLVKHFKKDPVKIFNLLCEVNAKLFKDFLHSEDHHIDMLSVQALIESIIFLIKHDTYRLKNIMPLMRNDHHLSVHSFNVAVYALQLAYPLRLSSSELTKLGYAALLHDLGKKHIDHIISKDGLLDDEEIKQVQEHTQYSIDVLNKNKIHDPVVLTLVGQHHERFDGSGYPKGLRKNDIHPFGAILSICDVFDSLTIDRPYRSKVSSFEALKLMITDPIMKNQFNQHHIKKLLSLL